MDLPTVALPQQLPAALRNTLRRLQVLPSRWLLCVHLQGQQMSVWKKSAFQPRSPLFPAYSLGRRYRVSTSRFGPGQQEGSHQTPRGLHRIAAKIGGGWPPGTVFRSRQVVGFTWRGWPAASIAHRILWLEGLEPGFNQGGSVDTFRRYIYIHGLADEPSLGGPASQGCIHLAAADLLPLFDTLPCGTLVWIATAPRNRSGA